MNIKQIKEADMDFTCKYCSGRIIITKAGYTCSSCGTIFDKNYQNENYFIQESESYKVKTSKQFVALGKKLDNVSNLGSYIDFYKSKFFYDKDNRPLSPKKQELFYRLKFLRDFRTKVEMNETYYRIVKILKNVSVYLKILPDVRQRALYLYKKILKISSRYNKKVPNHVSLIASCLFLACKEYSSLAPITIHEICNCFEDFGHRVNTKMIIRDVLKFKKYLNVDLKANKGEDYLVRLLNKLYNFPSFKSRFNVKLGNFGIKQYYSSLKKCALKIMNAIPKRIKDPRNPFILSGASIYGADVLLAKATYKKRVLTQKLLSDATGIAEYSIRDHYCSVIKPIVQLLAEKGWIKEEKN
ncbi:MAG: hypothetical protein ACTSYF_15175 [Promethearchaeota archaeon]